jgi:hypothetical protein
MAGKSNPTEVRCGVAGAGKDRKSCFGCPPTGLKDNSWGPCPTRKGSSCRFSFSPSAGLKESSCALRLSFLAMISLNHESTLFSTYPHRLLVTPTGTIDGTQAGHKEGFCHVLLRAYYASLHDPRQTESFLVRLSFLISPSHQLQFTKNHRHKSKNNTTMKLLFSLLLIAPAVAFVPATFGRPAFTLAAAPASAVEAALAASKKFGATSSEARVAWDGTLRPVNRSIL